MTLHVGTADLGILQKGNLQKSAKRIKDLIWLGNKNNCRVQPAWHSIIIISSAFNRSLHLFLFTDIF